MIFDQSHLPDDLDLHFFIRNLINAWNLVMHLLYHVSWGDLSDTSKQFYLLFYT
jgi:hypothetical protein